MFQIIKVHVAFYVSCISIMLILIIVIDKPLFHYNNYIILYYIIVIVPSQLVLSACVAAVKSCSVLHHSKDIFL